MMNSHPYIPVTIKVDYLSPTIHYLDILKVFFGLAAGLILFSWLLVSAFKRSVGDKLAFCWFVLTASIHFFVEGWWVSHWKTFTNDSFFLDELWKEYALSDSRFHFLFTGLSLDM